MQFRNLGPRICYSPEGAAGAGAAAGDTGNPGAGADKSAAPGNGSPAGDAKPSPFDGLQMSAENRDLVKAKGWQDFDRILGSYRDLETKIGKSILLPDAKAEAPEWEGFYEKIGRPKAATDFKFERPKGLPADAPYDAETAESMKALFHKAGLNPRQAAMLHDAVFEGEHKVSSEAATKQGEAYTKAHLALVKEWGEPESAGYMRNVELANRTLRNFGGTELITELKDAGVLGKGGEIRSPLLAQMLAKIGEQNFAEDALWSGGGEYKNPFAEKSEDLSEQAKILTKDPDRARALIRSAGRDPAEFML